MGKMYQCPGCGVVIASVFPMVVHKPGCTGEAPNKKLKVKVTPEGFTYPDDGTTRQDNEARFERGGGYNQHLD